MKLLLSILLLLVIIGVAGWIISKSFTNKKTDEPTADNNTPGIDEDNQTTPVEGIEHTNPANIRNKYEFFIWKYTNKLKPGYVGACMCVEVTIGDITKVYRFNGSYYRSNKYFTLRNIGRFKEKCTPYLSFEDIEKFAVEVSLNDNIQLLLGSSKLV